MNSHTLLWISTIVMLAGGIVILMIGKRRTPTEELHTVLHGIVPIIAACSYFAMATGQGMLLLPVGVTPTGSVVGRIFYYARYIDWAFTTPLLLITLSMTAMHAGRKRPGIIAGIVLSDVLMILTSFFFGLSETPILKWSWFIISCLAFVGVYYVIWISAMQANKVERDDVRSNYRSNALMLSVLWFIYPIVLILSPDGLGLIGDAAGVLCIGILDILTKVVYGIMTVSSDTKTTDRDLAEVTHSATLRTAA